MSFYRLMESAPKKLASHIAVPGLKVIVPVDVDVDGWQRVFFPGRFDRIRLSLNFIKSSRKKENYLIVRPEILELIEQTIKFKCDFAFYVGSAGPYQTYIAISLCNGVPSQVVKIAFESKARSVLENEFDVLRCLSTKVNNIPRAESLINGFGSTILVQSVVNGDKKASADSIGEAFHFLNELYIATATDGYFFDSRMYQNIQKWGRRVSAVRGDEWIRRVQEIEMNLLAGLSQKMPMVRAHRDFCPWNLRIDSSGMVHPFDWEFSESGYIPLYDYFHFLLMPMALKKRLTYKNCQKIVSNLKVNLKSKKLDANARVDVQLLAYLSDICLFYLESAIGFEIEDSPVIPQYVDIIDQLLKRPITAGDGGK